MKDSRLVSIFDIDDICEYKSDCSFEYYPVIHKDTQFQGMCDPFPHVEYDAFIFKTDSMHDSFDEENFQFDSNILSMLIITFIMSKWLRMKLVFICIMKVRMQI